MKGDDIAARLLDFAIGVLDVCEELPPTRRGRHISAQLMRAGTSGGANYEEARRAESHADFIHKVRVATKEVCESVYWLKIVERKRMHPLSGPLIQEANEITAILVSSAKTAIANTPMRS